MEYERRFRLDELPGELTGPSLSIRQVYWSLGNGWVLRLRRSGDSAQLDDTITIKGPRSGVGRAEFEFPMRAGGRDLAPAELAVGAQELYRAGSAAQVVKTRHSYLDERGDTWDIDEFHLENEGLIIAEIEGPTPVAVASVEMPQWAAEDVTGDARYNNENLAVRPWPTWR